LKGKDVFTTQFVNYVTDKLDVITII